MGPAAAGLNVESGRRRGRRRGRSQATPGFQPRETQSRGRSCTGQAVPSSQQERAITDACCQGRGDVCSHREPTQLRAELLGPRNRLREAREKPLHVHHFRGEASSSQGPGLPTARPPPTQRPGQLREPPSVGGSPCAMGCTRGAQHGGPLPHLSRFGDGGGGGALRPRNQWLSSSPGEGRSWHRQHREVKERGDGGHRDKGGPSSCSPCGDGRDPGTGDQVSQDGHPRRKGNGCLPWARASPMRLASFPPHRASSSAEGSAQGRWGCGRREVRRLAALLGGPRVPRVAASDTHVLTRTGQEVRTPGARRSARSVRRGQERSPQCPPAQVSGRTVP